MAYSFDAPCTYINFEVLHEQDDQDADSWFDFKSESAHEILKVPSASTRLGIEKSLTPNSKAALPLAIVTPVMKSVPESNLDTDEQREPLLDISVPDNIVTNLDAWRKSSTEMAAQPRRVSKRLSGHQRSEKQRKQLAKIRAERQTAGKEDELHPPVKKPKLAPGGQLTEGSVNSISQANVSQNKEMAVFSPRTKARSTMTIPSTPMVLKRKNSSSKLKSSEEQELEKMQQLQQEVAEHRRKNEESLKAAIAGAGQPLKRIVVEPTKPIDFHFRTDERIKQHGGNHLENSYKQVDFTTELRRHPPSPARVPKGPTIPKPFNLSCGSKRKLEETNSAEFVSLAQQIEAFQNRTPSRYHLRTRKKEQVGPSPGKPMKARITIPKTPALETKKRNRPVSCKSAAELEEEELEKLKQYKFKAQELDHRILEGGPLLPKKPPVKEPTQPIGFNLGIEKRIQQREPKKQEEEKFTFHPLPCPTKILQDRVGVPEKKTLPPTVPVSPAFALKNRVRLPKEEEKEEPPVIKANPLPHFGIPFKPKPLETKNVEVCPFSFETRDKVKQALKEKKIEELRKEEVPKFKALPIPDFDQITLPPKAVKPATNPEPFQLRIDERGTMKAERWGQMIQEELKQQKEAASFKARPNIVTHLEPFVPKKENRPPTEELSGSIVQDSFTLATEKRAMERMEFERRLAEKEALIEKKEEERRRYHEEHEKEEVARLREEAVHKANPIRKYRPVEVKPSDHPLTVPVSPKFSDRFCK